MSEAIWIAIITCFGTCLSALLVFIVQIKKLRNDNNENLNKNLKNIKDSMDTTLEQHRKEYLNGIDAVKKSVEESNNTLAVLQANNQSFQAVMEVRIDNLTLQFNDMKTEVREHNNFAKRMPVVEEKISVANHRIDDLEEANKRNINDGK